MDFTNVLQNLVCFKLDAMNVQEALAHSSVFTAAIATAFDCEGEDVTVQFTAVRRRRLAEGVDVHYSIETTKAAAPDLLEAVDMTTPEALEAELHDAAAAVVYEF